MPVGGKSMTWFLAAEFNDGKRVLLLGPRTLDKLKAILHNYRTVDWFPGRSYKRVIIRDKNLDGSVIDVYEIGQV